MFIQNTAYVNLLLFLECASRLEHVGLNKYFWYSYNDVFHNSSYSRGWGQHFSTLREPKLMTHWAPRVFELLDTPLSPICQEGQSERTFPIFAFSSRFKFLIFPIFPDFPLLFPFFGKFFWLSLALRCPPPLEAPPVATPLWLTDWLTDWLTE